jgi:hypothetical protein
VVDINIGRPSTSSRHCDCSPGSCAAVWTKSANAQQAMPNKVHPAQIRQPLHAKSGLTESFNPPASSAIADPCG